MSPENQGVFLLLKEVTFRRIKVFYCSKKWGHFGASVRSDWPVGMIPKAPDGLNTIRINICYAIRPIRSVLCCILSRDFTWWESEWFGINDVSEVCVRTVGHLWLLDHPAGAIPEVFTNRGGIIVYYARHTGFSVRTLYFAVKIFYISINNLYLIFWTQTVQGRMWWRRIVKSKKLIYLTTFFWYCLWPGLPWVRVSHR